jgi:2-phosphoglycerate kinase
MKKSLLQFHPLFHVFIKFKQKNMLKKEQTIQIPKYKFTNQGTILFITGVPLSGKSTIVPIINASIENCAVQSMDILRLIVQKIENSKIPKTKKSFTNYGSCDSYKLIGNGLYTPNNLIKGFNCYCKIVCSLLDSIIPKLEVRGVQNIIFEGIQLTPKIIAPYLKSKKNKLIIITTNKQKIIYNRKKLFGNNKKLHECYSGEKLMLLQNEILSQVHILQKNHILLLKI